MIEVRKICKKSVENRSSFQPFLNTESDKRRFTLNTLLEDVQAVLFTTPERWQLLVSALPLDLLTRSPAAGEWSALHCLQHLLVAERQLFPARLQAFLTGQRFSAFDPNQPHTDLDSQTPEQLAAAFAQARQESLALLKNVKDDELERTTRHPQFGTVTLAQMLHTWAAHDLMHTVQGERALIQPFILGCGPWRPFFRDHEVSGAQEER